MHLLIEEPQRGITFVRVPLRFDQARQVDLFARKNNKTLAETLEHRRYARFASTVAARYADSLHEPLGTFLLHLKQQGDTFYSEAELVCLIPKDHELGAMETIHVADLEGYPLIALGRLSPASAPIRETLNAAGLGSAVLIETNLSSAVYALVAASAGVAIIDPLAKLSNTYSNLEIRPFRPTVRVRTECLTSRFRPLSILGAQFLQELQSVVAEIAVSSPFLSVSQPTDFKSVP